VTPKSVSTTVTLPRIFNFYNRKSAMECYTVPSYKIEIPSVGFTFAAIYITTVHVQ